MLRTTIVANPPRIIQEAQSAMGRALTTTMHVTRCVISRTLGTSPGALVFRRYMFFRLVGCGRFNANPREMASNDQ